METSKLDIRATIKDVVVPLLIALIPFLPNIYDSFTEPEFHFVYESTYTKNPVIEWNRQIDKLLSQIGTSSKGAGATPPDLITQKIGKEIYDALPVMMSGIGFKPMDKKTVTIVNVSRYDLRNIRVHFTGCTGFDSYETSPDALGSAENRNIPSSHPTDRVTIRYDSLPRSPQPLTQSSHKDTTITFYGEDAAQCRPTVEAELAKGSAAVGKEVPDHSFYIDDIAEARSYKERLGDWAFKVFLAIAALYLYLQIRSLKKRIRQDG